MSQDPYSNYNSENPYGTPPPQNPYGATPDPYAGQQQVPYQGSAQNPYGAPPNPYGVPPQGPYGVPPQGAYGTPGYGPNQEYGPYAPSAPLPLDQAVRQLPDQYIKVVTNPSAQTFAQEMGKASWDIVWVQLLIYAVIAGIFGYISTLIPGTLFRSPGTVSPIPPAALQAILVGASLGTIIVIPTFFFIGEGIIYLIAKAFGGTGTFLQQSYSHLLFKIPLGIITSALGLIPLLGGLVWFGIYVYEIVLHIFSIMAAHRLSGGKATAVVLLPFLIAFALFCALFIALIALAAGASHSR
ncbi:MAG: hypothetical protein E6J34_16070 [Chloroflexi bacterium]|nr:MAG: hypothetical protein E6J34_16070 [Chloroflexota bacterium]